MITRKRRTNNFYVGGENEYKFVEELGELKSLNGEKISIGTDFSNEEIVLTLDGTEHKAQIVSIKKNKCTVLVNGNSYNFVIDTEISKRRKEILARDEDEKEQEVLAPIPGKIVDVFVAKGQNVEAGQIILTLEAMKMQNEILAPISGVVTELNIKPEQVVVAGHKMAIIEVM
ncbi:biotin/lipoyl-binding protein [Halosquirtibacter laminarini]|uniref:Biotin/lipoyl-binding protein n=1 Tax=Halosquirtibacter laminarini TaxID=3374600 RepID=A0AC61NFZ8_9BACT|nr:biotin/lipoyl-binding protein [Prolixibacteraceae bacterium]